MAEYLAGYDRPISSLARFVLKTIEDVYEEASIDLPDRRLLTIGSVAVDEPLVAVMYGGLVAGPPGNETNFQAHGGMLPRTALFNIEIWRETPAIGPSGLLPSSAEESKAAEATMQDTWLLAESALRTDQMLVGVVYRIGVHAPEGQLAGCSMTLEVQIP